MSESDPGESICASAGSHRPRDRRNQKRYVILMFAWAVCFVAITFLAKARIIPEGPVSWATAFAPSILALWAAAAYRRYLREADELLRSIELYGLALAVGAGFIVWPAYRVMEAMGAPLGDWSDVAPVAMCVCYTVGVIVGRLRYL